MGVALELLIVNAIWFEALLSPDIPTRCQSILFEFNREKV